MYPAQAAEVAFGGPPGWAHADATAPAPGATRTVDQWHLGALSTVTFVKDDSVAYADALATIEKNFSANSIKPAIDKDLSCQGKTGHVIDFSTGPDGHKIAINRVLVPDGSGIVTITYTRADGSTFDEGVQKAESAYCAGSAS